MLNIIKNAKTKTQDREIEEWREKFKDEKLIWNFEEIETILKSGEIKEDVKERILEVVKKIVAWAGMPTLPIQRVI